MSSPPPSATHQRVAGGGGRHASLRESLEGGAGAMIGTSTGDRAAHSFPSDLMMPSPSYHSHVAALPGARDPLHRRSSAHAFLRGRELLRLNANMLRRPGVDAFAADGRGVGCGIIPIVPPNTGVESPPFVLRFCRETHGNKLLAVADEEGMVTVVDASKKLPGADIDPDFRPTHQWLAHANAIFDIAWCHGDQRMLTAGGDKTIRLWDVETAVAQCSFKHHRGSVKAVSVRPSGNYAGRGEGGGGGGEVFASCGRDGLIALWDARESRRRRYAGRSGMGADGEPSAVPTAVIERAHEPPAAMGGGMARGIRTRAEPYHRRSEGGVWGRRTTRSATRAAAAAEASTARARPEPSLGAHSVTSVVFAHDGQVLVSAGAADGIVKLWDVRQLSKGVPVAQITDSDPPFEVGGTNCGWLRDDGGRGGDYARRRRGRGVTALALAPGGSSRIAAAYSDSHIALFDLHAPNAGPSAHLRGHRANSFYVKAAFSPEGTHVASGSVDQHVYVWQVDRPREPPTVLKGHEGEVTAVDWCPSDFDCLASCADDCTARVWTIDRREKECNSVSGNVLGVGMTGERSGAGRRWDTRSGSRENDDEDGHAVFGLGAGGVFRTPAITREPDRLASSTRSRLTGGEWLASAIEEGRRLDFETPMPTFGIRNGGSDATGLDLGIDKEGGKGNVDANASGDGKTCTPGLGGDSNLIGAAPTAAALLTPGPVAARTRRATARRPPREGDSNSNSILTYFTPQRGGGVGGEEGDEEEGRDNAR